MSIEQYFTSQQLCWGCRKACGGCRWSSRGKPVPGWTATPMRRNAGTNKGVPVIMDTYRITACPQFVAD